MTRYLVAAAFLGLNLYVYHGLATGEVVPERQRFEAFPDALGAWRCAGREALEAPVVRNLGVTDYLLCNFVRNEPRALVNLYVGYHATQVRREGGGAGENAIHPPKHCLPGSGWDIVGARQLEVDMPGMPERPARIKRFVIAKGPARQAVYYWYHSRGRVIAEDWRKIVDLFWDRATRGRTDGALVRFTIPLGSGGEAAADRAFEEFAPRVVARLSAFVPE